LEIFNFLHGFNSLLIVFYFISFPYPHPETHHNLVLLLSKEKETFDFGLAERMSGQ